MNDGANVSAAVEDRARSHPIDFTVVDPDVVSHKASKCISDERHLVELDRAHVVLFESSHDLTLRIDREDEVSLALFELRVEGVEFLAQALSGARSRRSRVSARAPQRLADLGIDRNGGQGVESESSVEALPKLCLDMVPSQLLFELKLSFPARR
jgi:hypothetical protein